MLAWDRIDLTLWRNRPPTRLVGFPHSGLVPLLVTGLSAWIDIRFATDWHDLCQSAAYCCQSRFDYCMWLRIVCVVMGVSAWQWIGLIGD